MVDYVLHQERRLIVPKNSHGYIGISGTRFMVEREQSHGGYDFDQMNLALSQEGYFMPSPAIFMPYRNQVIKASNSDVTLYDGSGKRISRNDADLLAQLLIVDCWIYIYAKFSGKNGRTITYNRIKNAETIEEVTEKLQFPKGIKDGSLVDFVWNKQGMPTRKSKVQKFDANKNLCFYGPLDGSVARFGSRAAWAVLNCGGGPQGSDGGLGTFACTAGARKF